MAELDLSFRRAAARSGGLVSHATLNNIVLGRHSGHFDDETLRGVALALDLAQSKVREAAGEDRQTPSEFRLPKKANRLTPAERAAILKMVDALLDAHSDRK
jgi:hypothetical protein